MNLREEIEQLKQENEELSTEVFDMINVAFYYAGFKKSSLEKVLELYIESIDEVFDEDVEVGFLEIVKLIEHIKKGHRELLI